MLCEEKLKMIHDSLDQGGALDTIADHDRLMTYTERGSTKMFYKLVKQGVIDPKITSKWIK